MSLILADATVTEIVDFVTGQILGYGIETVPTEEEIGHHADERLQRWLLFCGTGEEMKTWNDRIRRFQRPRDPEWDAIKTGADFATKADKCFQKGRDVYVVANCRSFKGDDLTGVSAPAVFPSQPPEDFQMDFRVADITKKASTVGAVEVLCGRVNVQRGGTGVRTESWALFTNYAFPTDTGTYRVRPPESQTAADFAALIDGRTWTAGCTFVTAVCAYYANGVPVGG